MQPTSIPTSRPGGADPARHPWAERLAKRLAGPLQPATETMVLGTSLWIALTCNRPFWTAITAGHEWRDSGSWLFAASLLTALTALHSLLLGLFASRHTVRPLLATAVLVSAVASYYMGVYGIYLDPGMIRNTLHTERKEAFDLLGPGLAWHVLLVAGPPLLILARCRPRRLQPGSAILRRIFTAAGTATVLVAAVLAAYPSLASPIRNQRELRYLITPANLFWSTVKTAATDHTVATLPRQPIGLDARRTPTATGDRPRLLLLIIGETARAANWGLSGYERDTTPGLRQAGVINFAQVTACGTDTETSVPCLFAPVGRRDYDEAHIRRSESLLHVLATAGYDIRWTDNQTGCKGVCEGLPYQSIDNGSRPDCPPGRCLDMHLLDDLDSAFDGRDRVVVLHMIGSHGPAYDHRYPPGQAFYKPVCGRIDLHRCSADEIRNSYDNTLRYTDAVLSEAISRLQHQQDRYDTALLYVSDHGESLGERRLFLHGVPWRIAPAEQTRVPMVLWLSAGIRSSLSLVPDCLEQAARQPRSHDHVFHTVLGLLDVQTRIHEPAFDLVSPCRRSPVMAATN